MKYTIVVKPDRLQPGGPVEVEDDKILCNDVRLPGEHHPYNLRLWVLGNEHGPLGALWATNEQDALDELVNSGLGDGILMEESDADEDTLRAGNASEPIESDHLWMGEAEFDITRDFALLIKFAEARGAAVDNLGKL